MADELRWEQLFSQLADGQTEADAISIFQNTTQKLMHIRKINGAHLFSAAEAGENTLIELAKARSARPSVNNDSGFKIMDAIGMPTGAIAQDGSVGANSFRQFAKGEVTLEPNEVLAVSITKSSGGSTAARHMIGYHF